jgi:nicotinate-nucleotide pyrophosphorylase (carboxylating)
VESPPNPQPTDALETLVRRALAEDAFDDDVTTRLLEEAGAVPATAVVVAKESGVFSGEAAVAALARVLPLRFELRIVEGAPFQPKHELLSLSGPRSLVLSTERTVLNLLTHACGVATRARAFVDAVKPHRARILATRKTLPGLRALELAAVRAGGAFVHRRSLADGILLKENHQRYVPTKTLVERARASRSPLHRIEVEVQSMAELRALESCFPDIVMLDNFDDATVAEAIRWIAGRAEVEVSGNMTPERARAVAAAGADWISAGSITHSAKSIDLSLDWRSP